MDLNRLLHPRTIAVVRASERSYAGVYERGAVTVDALAARRP